MTKTEKEILAMAYYWADNPTDRQAKRELWKAVQADRKRVLKKAEQNWLRIRYTHE